MLWTIKHFELKISYKSKIYFPLFRDPKKQKNKNTSGTDKHEDIENDKGRILFPFQGYRNFLFSV